jgi:hypothetical protein
MVAIDIAVAPIAGMALLQRLRCDISVGSACSSFRTRKDAPHILARQWLPASSIAFAISVLE